MSGSAQKKDNTVSRLADLYERAMALPPERRSDFADKEAGDSPELKKALLALFADESNLIALGGAIDPQRVSRLSEISPTSKGPRLVPGQKILDFEIVRELGEGGFAVVYLARQVSLDRLIALKITVDFAGEARILAHLEHENIVRVYSESVQPDSHHKLICMQYVDGKTLSQVIRELGEQSFPPEEGNAILRALRSDASSPQEAPERRAGGSPLAELDFHEAALWIGARIADALDYAHRKGILHLDVKPSNILLDRNARPFLTDFNASRDTRGTHTSAPGFLVGTPIYMSPEHDRAMNNPAQLKALAGQLDGRADIFSLGTVIAELMCGTRSNLRESRSVLATVAWRRFRRQSQLPRVKGWHSIDPGIQLLIAKCTAEERDQRFESASRMAEALDGCIELRHVMKAMPVGGLITRAVERFPLPSVLTLWTLPILAAAWLSSWLAAQSLIAHGEPIPPYFIARMGLSLSAGVALSCSVFAFRARQWLYLVYRPFWLLGNAERAELARGRLLAMGDWGFKIGTLVGLPASVVATYLTDYFSSTISTSDWANVLSWFGLLGVLALASSSLLVNSVASRSFYPRLWLGRTQVRKRASPEITRLVRQSKFYFALLLALPLLTMLVIALSPTDTSLSKSSLLTLLGSVAAVGITFSFLVSHRLAAIRFALSQTSKASRF